jgi:ADP-ribose pyrophosphatase YjhB (NUDIX family)
MQQSARLSDVNNSQPLILETQEQSSEGSGLSSMVKQMFKGMKESFQSLWEWMNHSVSHKAAPDGPEAIDGKVYHFFKDFKGWRQEAPTKSMLVHPNFSPKILHTTESGLEDAVQAFHKEYTKGNAPMEGAYGDYVTVTALSEKAFMVTAVGQMYFPLIKEAADMCVVAKVEQADGSFRYKTVLVDRGFAPMGLAFPGGFCDVSKGAEAPVHAAFREFREEAGNAAKRLGVSLAPVGRDNNSLKEDYNVTVIPTEATVGDMKFKATTTRMGTIKTSDDPFGKGGEVLKDGSKRVHRTTGCACVIEVPQDHAQDLDSWIGAGDDAQAVQWIDITGMVNGNAEPSAVVARRKIDGEMRDVSLDAEHIAFGHHIEILQMLVTHLKK